MEVLKNIRENFTEVELEVIDLLALRGAKELTNEGEVFEFVYLNLKNELMKGILKEKSLS